MVRSRDTGVCVSVDVDLFEPVIRSFEVPTALRGNAYTLEDGTTWYPEYIVPKHIDSSYEPRLVLNGFLIGLANLYEANQIINSTRLTKVFNRGIISAAANLYRHDSDYNWTLYHLDQPMKLANNNYHRIYIDLTSRLYEYTNVSIFRFYSEKWRQYDSKPLFTWEELTCWEFISNGLVMVGIILGPLVLIEIGSTLIRRKLKEKRD